LISNFLRLSKTDREKLSARKFVKKYVIQPHVFLEFPVRDVALEIYYNKEIIDFLIKAGLLKKGRKIKIKKPIDMRATTYYHEWKFGYGCACSTKYSSKHHYCPKCGAKAIVY